MNDSRVGTDTFRVWRGLAGVGGFSAFCLWFFTLLGGFGETASKVAAAALVAALLMGVFFAFATDDRDPW